MNNEREAIGIGMLIFYLGVLAVISISSWRFEASIEKMRNYDRQGGIFYQADGKKKFTETDLVRMQIHEQDMADVEWPDPIKLIKH